MSSLRQSLLTCFIAALGLAGCHSAPGRGGAKMAEANAVLSGASRQQGITADAFAKRLVSSRYSSDQNVFLPSALAVDFRAKTVTLPLYEGVGPTGRPTFYIITEADDFDVAKRLGVNYSPKLANARNTGGVQKVTLEGGKLRFAGDVDFAPERSVKAGPKMTIPPAEAKPGSVGDPYYSPLIVTPYGQVLNAPIVANEGGQHDHAVAIDRIARTITFELLDGFEGGEEYYFHLVTDASDAVPAAIERGTLAPRLALLPTFGKSMVGDGSALLGFAPVANGETGAANPQRQGLNSTVVDGVKFDPINVFPLDPDNGRRQGNNYSPMWDAHIYVWTDEAVAAGKRRRVTSTDELKRLVEEGLVMNAPDNAGEPNPLIGGLKPSKAIINCPVIAQPKHP